MPLEMWQKANRVLRILKKEEKMMFSTTTLIMHSATMATKSLVPVPPVYESSQAKLQSVRMKWLVVTDRKGNRRPQMHWCSN